MNYLCIVNAIMAPQLHQTVCVNASNTTSDAASVSSAVERSFVNSNFIWIVTTLQFFIILTEFIETK